MELKKIETENVLATQQKKRFFYFIFQYNNHTRAFCIVYLLRSSGTLKMQWNVCTKTQRVCVCGKTLSRKYTKRKQQKEEAHSWHSQIIIIIKRKKTHIKSHKVKLHTIIVLDRICVRLKVAGRVDKTVANSVYYMVKTKIAIGTGDERAWFKNVEPNNSRKYTTKIEKKRRKKNQRRRFWNARI